MNKYLIALYEQQWKDDPRSRVFLPLAEQYRKGGVFDKAADVCLKGLANHPKYVPALVCLGRCQLELERLTESEDAFQRVLAITPDNLHAIRGMARIHHLAGRLDQAKPFCDILLLQEPDDEDALRILEAIDKEALENQTDQTLDTEPMTQPLHAGEENDPADSSLDFSDSQPESSQLEMSDSFEADQVEIPEEALIIPPASSVDLETGPLEPLDEDSMPVIDFDQSTEEPVPQVEALDTEPLDDPNDFAGPVAIRESEQETEPLEPEALAPEIPEPDAQDPERVEPEALESEELEPEATEPAQPVQNMDDIDLQFELALKDDEKAMPIFPDAPDDAPPAGQVSEPVIQTDGPSEPLTEEDEALVTLSLKHERMMHFEETARILHGLLDKYPRDPSVRQNLERVGQLMASETRRNKKIRLLSNWLDKIKGVYYVQ